MPPFPCGLKTMTPQGLLLKPLTSGPQRDAAVERFRFFCRLMGHTCGRVFVLVLGEKLRGGGGGGLGGVGGGLGGRGGRGGGGE